MEETLHILLIEDDQDDIDLFRYALKAKCVHCKLAVIMQGDEVAPYLAAATEQPDVIVMDLNLPMVHGREVLKLIKQAEGYRDTPVVILTTSSAREDREYCLALGADDFITKPTSVDAFNATITTVEKLALANK
ncbi:response regulator [Spirosoma soli]|uniref:Response regulator n=1 Tax=Spirosoma soli TaxID=1770529 RepID=A0ABW5M0Z1_9BACT